MKGYETMLAMTKVYQDKYLINKENFVRGACLAFHRRAQGAWLCINFKTLTIMRGAYGGVFL